MFINRTSILDIRYPRIHVGQCGILRGHQGSWSRAEGLGQLAWRLLCYSAEIYLVATRCNAVHQRAMQWSFGLPGVQSAHSGYLPEFSTTHLVSNSFVSAQALMYQSNWLLLLEAALLLCGVGLEVFYLWRCCCFRDSVWRHLWYLSFGQPHHKFLIYSLWICSHFVADLSPDGMSGSLSDPLICTRVQVAGGQLRS